MANGNGNGNGVVAPVDPMAAMMTSLTNALNVIAPHNVLAMVTQNMAGMVPGVPGATVPVGGQYVPVKVIRQNPLYKGGETRQQMRDRIRRQQQYSRAAGVSTGSTSRVRPDVVLTRGGQIKTEFY